MRRSDIEIGKTYTYQERGDQWSAKRAPTYRVKVLSKGRFFATVELDGKKKLVRYTSLDP